MANKTILMSRIRQILRLYTQGQSNKKISELTCSSRNTVKKYIHKFIHEHLTYDAIKRQAISYMLILPATSLPLLIHKQEK